MILLHYGIRGGMSGAEFILSMIVCIVGLLFFAVLGIATNGFKHPSDEQKKDNQAQHRK